MYDLEFANFGNPVFNSHEQFAFIRKHKNEVVLVVVNFYDKPVDLEVNIPFEAFQYLNLQDGNYYSARNLLNEQEEFPIQRITSAVPYRLQLPAWRGKILKLKKENVVWKSGNGKIEV